MELQTPTLPLRSLWPMANSRCSRGIPSTTSRMRKGIMKAPAERGMERSAGHESPNTRTHTLSCTFMHTLAHIHIHSLKHILTHALTHVHTRTDVHTPICICTHTLSGT